MQHLPHLITDLALILGVASIVTLLFKSLKQPLVLGYIIAGVLVSSNFSFFPTVSETENVALWAEIGVIFLLFSLGLEFSFKKLAQVGGSATISAVVEAAGMMSLGYLIGKVLNWSVMDSIYLGAALAVSSTTIILKAVEELGLKKRKFATLVFGILIVEDLITIALLVLLSTLSLTQQFDGANMLLSVLKLVFFLIIWFVAGIFFIPSLLQRLKKVMNDETLLISAISLCLLMVYLAYKAGFSPALGAFVMGSLLAETTQSEKIEHLVKPVKDLFGAIFFVSVGMLINLQTMATFIWPILIITVACILGKIVTTGLGAYMSGNSLKVSIQTGMSLAQIGEFSFIIAALGTTLKVTSDFLYPIIIAVSGITTFTTPYLIRLSEPLHNRIDKMLSPALREKLNRYSTEATTITTTSDWQKVLKSFLINVTLFSVILVAIIYLVANYTMPWLEIAMPWLANIHEDNILAKIIVLLLALLIMAPFLWALFIRNEKTESFARIYAQQKYRGPIWLMRGLKLSIGGFLIVYLLERVLSLEVAIGTGAVMLLLFFVFRKRIQGRYDRIESRFIRNLNDKQLQEELLQKELSASRRNVRMAPWDAHMTSFEVLPEAINIVGKTLLQLQWRERIGVNVAMIKRGAISIIPPTRDETIYPGDKLFIICTDSQERRMNALLRPDKKIVETSKEVQMKLDQLTIEAGSTLINKSIRDSNIRNIAHGLVVGIERNGERFLNPESTWVFEEGDLVWIVGEKKLINTIADDKATEGK